MAYLFNEIRYELNGIEIDRTRHLGVASDLRNYISIKRNQQFLLQNSGWSIDDDLKIEKGNFNFCVRLNLLLRFAEDYNKQERKLTSASRRLYTLFSYNY